MITFKNVNCDNIKNDTCIYSIMFKDGNLVVVNNENTLQTMPLKDFFMNITSWQYYTFTVPAKVSDGALETPPFDYVLTSSGLNGNPKFIILYADFGNCDCGCDDDITIEEKDKFYYFTNISNYNQLTYTGNFAEFELDPENTLVPVESNIRIKLDKLYTDVSINAGFVITPNIPGNLDISTVNGVKNVVYKPTQPFEYGTKYTINFNNLQPEPFFGTQIPLNTTTFLAPYDISYYYQTIPNSITYYPDGRLYFYYELNLNTTDIETNFSIVDNSTSLPILGTINATNDLVNQETVIVFTPDNTLTPSNQYDISISTVGINSTEWSTNQDISISPVNINFSINTDANNNIGLVFPDDSISVDLRHNYDINELESLTKLQRKDALSSFTNIEDIPSTEYNITDTSANNSVSLLIQPDNKWQYNKDHYLAISENTISFYPNIINTLQINSPYNIKHEFKVMDEVNNDNISINDNIIITFDTLLNEAEVISNFVITPSITGTITVQTNVDGFTEATFVPDAPLTYNTTYTIEVNNVTEINTAIIRNYTFFESTYTNISIEDEYKIDETITIDFHPSIDETFLLNNTEVRNQTGDIIVDATISTQILPNNDIQLIIDPVFNLDFSTIYTVRVYDSTIHNFIIEDVDINTLEDLEFNFYTKEKEIDPDFDKASELLLLTGNEVDRFEDIVIRNSHNFDIKFNSLFGY